MLNRDRTLYALSRFLREFLFAEKNTSLKKNEVTPKSWTGY